MTFTRHPSSIDTTRRRRWRTHVSATVALGTVVGLALASSALAAAMWSNAIEVPGTAAINVGGSAQVQAVSCSPDGSCAAIGNYEPSINITQAFVVSETDDVWGTAMEVPGIATLNVGNTLGDIYAISCTSSGNCSAGGSYTDTNGVTQSFVTDEVNGTWEAAEEVPGTAALNAGDKIGGLLGISCPSTGDCVLGGIYTDAFNYAQAYVDTESDDTWGTAVPVPGVADLNVDGVAALTGLSCDTTTSCTAEGFYADLPGNLQTWVATESAGVWAPATELSNTQVLNAGGFAVANQIVCPNAVSCTTAGLYTDAAKHDQAFVDDEVGGTWNNAIEVPGTAFLDAGGNAETTSVACTSPGNCSAGGTYADGAGDAQAFIDNEVSGVWGTANEVLGTAALNVDGNAYVNSVACSTPGDCVAGGVYTDSAKHSQAFVVDEVSGTWGSAFEVPGTSTLNAGAVGGVNSVACSAAGDCAAGGSYTDAASALQAFVSNYTAPSTTTTTVPVTKAAPGPPSIRAASPVKGEIVITVLGAGSGASGYQYQVNGGAWTRSTNGASKTIDVRHLTPGKTYRVRVRAVSASGDGAPSRTLSVTVK